MEECFTDYLRLQIQTQMHTPTLVLKSARRTEANRVSKRKARGEGARIMDARRTSTQIFLKNFHIPQNIFCINKLDKCIKKVTKINITTKTASNLKKCVVLS